MPNNRGFSLPSSCPWQCVQGQAISTGKLLPKGEKRMDKEKRTKRAIEKYGRAFLALLGSMPDRALAAQFDLEHSRVTRLRNALGIPAFFDTSRGKARHSLPRVVVVFDDLANTAEKDAIAAFLEKFREARNKAQEDKSEDKKTISP